MALRLRSLLKSRSESVDDAVADIARVLANMMFMGVEKRARCAFNDGGVCRRLEFSSPMPGLAMVEDGGVYRIVVSKHPEICAVCPFWKPRREG